MNDEPYYCQRFSKLLVYYAKERQRIKINYIMYLYSTFINHVPYINIEPVIIILCKHWAVYRMINCCTIQQCMNVNLRCGFVTDKITKSNVLNGYL